MNIILKLGNCNFNTHPMNEIDVYKFPPYTIISFEREYIFETRRNRQNFKQSLVKAAWERGVFVPTTNMCWLDASILYDFDTARSNIASTMAPLPNFLCHSTEVI